jgi:bla regulator protein BlaR1
MNPSYFSPIANHLWQSTLFAGVVGLLTLALRKNRARVRHGLWLAASCKFLIPLSVLIALGGHIARRTAPETAHSNVSVVMNQVSQPFTAPMVSWPLLATAADAAGLLPAVLSGIWACGFIGITCSWWVRWRRIRAAVRAGSPLYLEIPIRARSSPSLLEPGVFGVFRPVLFLPEGIFGRLTPAQLKAVIAHELCHVQHRDNLIAAIHMFVESVFWFYPLAWWIGKRMVEERERACDEEVLRSGSEPGVYAQGILQVCKSYLESPLVCASGVTGSDLKKRIELIMSGRWGHSLTSARKLMLAAAGVASIAAPVSIGVLNAPQVRAQSQGAMAPPAFEVADVKVNKSADPDMFGDVLPTWLNPGGRVAIRGATMKWLITEAYHLEKDGVAGGPKWLDLDCFDVVAKPTVTASRNDVRLMLQKLLADRFGLRVHPDQRVMPVYALLVGKGGPKLMKSNDAQKAKDGCQPAAGVPDQLHLECHNLTMPDLADTLPQLAPVYLDLPVVDLTDLKGAYDFKLNWTPMRGGRGGPGRGADAPPVVDSALTIFGAVEALGLKLEQRKHSVGIVVIDRVERIPTEN